MEGGEDKETRVTKASSNAEGKSGNVERRSKREERGSKSRQHRASQTVDSGIPEALVLEAGRVSDSGGDSVFGLSKSSAHPRDNVSPEPKTSQVLQPKGSQQSELKARTSDEPQITPASESRVIRSPDDSKSRSASELERRNTTEEAKTCRESGHRVKIFPQDHSASRTSKHPKASRSPEDPRTSQASELQRCVVLEPQLDRGSHLGRSEPTAPRTHQPPEVETLVTLEARPSTSRASTGNTASPVYTPVEDDVIPRL
nr:uncharacterized protein LOC123748011 [Procambarus clarkii]